jgi:MFS family permease
MSRSRLWSYENGLLVLLTISLGFTIWDRVALTILGPAILTDLKLNNTALGIMAAALSVTLAVSGYHFGRIADQSESRKRLLLGGILLFSLFSSISGLAISMMTLVAARLFMGLTEGPILPLSYSIIALESSPNRRAFNHGVMANFATCLLGGVFGPVILTHLATAYSWRVAFFVTGIPGLIMAALIWRFVREPRAPVAVAAAAPAHAVGSTAVRPGMDRNVWLCALLLCGLYTWLLVTLTFMPVYLVKVVGLSLIQTGNVAAIMGFSGLTLAIVVSWCADRFGRKPTIIVSGLIGLLTPLGVLFAHQSIVLMTALAFVGWSFIGCSPLFAGTIPSESVATIKASRTVALIIGVAEIIGGVLLPVASGLAADRWGLDAPMWVVFGATLLTVIGSCFLIETRPRAVRIGAAVPAA